MEQSLFNPHIIFHPILPFMNHTYFEILFTSSNLDYTNIQIIEGEIHLPKYAIISVDSHTRAQSLIKFFNQMKNYPNLSYRLSICNILDIDQISYEKSKKDKDILKFHVNYEKIIDNCYEISNKYSGLLFKDKDLLDKQSKVVSYLLKNMGTNLLKGISIMNTSLPVNIFDKRTLLQVTAYQFSFAPIFISRAYYSIDPLEKLKWVTTFLISQLHISPMQTKPFNPIIGETFQCKIGNLNYYAEQTLNKPPTWNFYVIDDEKLFKIYGYVQTEASTGANTCKIIRRGTVNVDFGENGGVFEIHYPGIHLNGLTIGKRLFNFTKETAIFNKKENLASHIIFNPDEKVGLTSLFSSIQKTSPDTIRGDLLRADELTIGKDNHFIRKKGSKSLGVIHGEWTNFLKFDDMLYFRSKTYPLVNKYKMDYILPSDSTLREDLQMFIAGNESEAQIIKEKYEDVQRRDRIMREQYVKEIFNSKKK